MGRLRKFVALPGEERRLVLTAAALMVAIRLSLWVLPFRTLHRVTGIPPRPSAVAGHVRPLASDRIVWAVAAAGRFVPWSTCLVRALAARTLLSRHGHPSELRLGVARRRDGAFEAHAWLEHDEQVLVGGPLEGRYTPLPSLADRT